MHSNTLALLLTSLTATSALTIPRQPNPLTTQHLLVQLFNEVTFLANEYVHFEQPIAREVYVTIQDELSQLAPLVLNEGTECQAQSYECIDTLSQAITTLNNTDNYLATILMELPYQNTEEADITTAYCNANNSINSLDEYTYDYSGSDNSAVTPLIAETYTLISLKALQASLGIIENGQASTTYSQTAFNNTQKAVATFATAENVTGPYSCPLDQVQPANDSSTALEYAGYLLEEVVPKALEDGEGDVSGFCEIGFYLSAIDDYVKA